MPRHPRRMKRRIGFTIGEPESVVATPGPEVAGDAVEQVDNLFAGYGERRKHGKPHPFVRPPVLR